MSGEMFFNKALKIEKKFTLWSKKQNKETASELYKKAGDQFKYEKKIDRSIISYEKASECYIYNNDNLSAGKCNELIGNLLKNIDSDLSIEKYLFSIELYSQSLNFPKIAKLYNKISDIYENEFKYQLSIEYLIKSIDNYDMDESYTVTIFNLQYKIADLYLKIGNHLDAIIWYEKTLKNIDNCLLKYKLIDSIFMSISCQIYLCLNEIYNFPKIEKYTEEYIIFTQSRECQFIVSLIDSLKNRSIEDLNILYEKYSSLFNLNIIREKLFYDIKTNWEIVLPAIPEENFR